MSEAPRRPAKDPLMQCMKGHLPTNPKKEYCHPRVTDEARRAMPHPTPLPPHAHALPKAPGCVHRCVSEAWTAGKQQGPCGDDAEACLSDGFAKGHGAMGGLPPKGMSKLSRCREMASETWPGATAGVWVCGKPPEAGLK